MTKKIIYRFMDLFTIAKTLFSDYKMFHWREHTDKIKIAWVHHLLFTVWPKSRIHFRIFGILDNDQTWNDPCDHENCPQARWKWWHPWSWNSIQTIGGIEWFERSGEGQPGNPINWQTSTSTRRIHF